MTRLKRIARLIFSALPAHIVQKLAQKYDVEPELIADIEQRVEGTNLPNKDTVTEWIIDNITARAIRWPEDFPRLARAAEFFFVNSGNPKFAEMAGTLIHSPGKMRNIFTYQLHTLEFIEERFEDTPDKVNERERLNKLGELPGESRIVYNKSGVIIVEAGDTIAACALAKGTKWCTSDKDTAKDYLAGGSLYVIYEGGKKTAQMTLPAHNEGFQYMDLQDNPVVPSPKVVSAFKELKWWDSILLDSLGDEAFVAAFESSILDKNFRALVAKYPRQAVNYASFILKSRFPEAEAVIATSPPYAEIYAYSVLHGPWPEAEAVIATDAVASFKYATMVLKARFPLGEPIMAKYSRVAADYARIYGKFKLGEPAIAKDLYTAFDYATQVIQDRFTLFEPLLIRTAENAGTDFMEDYFLPYAKLLQSKGKLKTFLKTYKDEWVIARFLKSAVGQAILSLPTTARRPR